MQLKKLLNQVNLPQIPSQFQRLEIKSISCDSREVAPGGLFVAVSGPTRDGADFISDAVGKGARVVITSGKAPRVALPEDVCLIGVADARRAWKEIVHSFFGDPSHKVRTFGVTGTNGKTTVTYLIESILRESGAPCGIMGTIGHRLGSEVIAAKNTTPGLLENQRLLSEMVRKKIPYCAMEVSSHALEQGRVELIDFAAAVFTNLTGDHLDYHHDMESYFQAKASLFTNLGVRATAVINTDDAYGRRLVSMTPAQVLTYGLTGKPAVTASEVQLNFRGSRFQLATPAGNISVDTPLIGRHNVYNILAASATCLSQGVSPKAIRDGIQRLKGVPGRLERVTDSQAFEVFVDYAHTEDALRNVLGSLRDVSPNRIILVFGCGGDRDKTKRPKMGRVASQMADFVIITSDNPRSEDPVAIMAEIRRGCERKNYSLLEDRQAAIRGALEMAKASDIVLIAGKGHEDYQVFKDRTIHFDDREVVRELLRCSR